MTTHKFRGLPLAQPHAGFRYGYYYAEHLYGNPAKHLIRDIEGQQYYVVSESVGQFTGLLDRNWKEIYEGDILAWSCENIHWTVPPVSDQVYVVVWHEWKFHCDPKGRDMGWIINWHTSTKTEHLQVIGNIYENPELLIAQ